MGFSLSLIAQPAPKTAQEKAIELQRRSIALQEQSVARQRAAAGPADDTPRPRWTFPVQAEAPAPTSDLVNRFDCAPAPTLLLQSAVQNASGLYHVPVNLINAVIHQESAGYPCAVSDKGAMGLMQLMPSTAAEMGATQPFDISQNVYAGTRLLADLIQRYGGDLNRVLAAYNAGAANVDRFGGPPPFPETLNYIRSVIGQINPPFDPKLFPAPIR